MMNLEEQGLGVWGQGLAKPLTLVRVLMVHHFGAGDGFSEIVTSLFFADPDP